MRLCDLSHRRPAKAQASLRIRALSPEPSLFANMKYGSRRRVRPNIRHLAPLDGCACAFEEWVYGGWKVLNQTEITRNRTKYKLYFCEPPHDKTNNAACAPIEDSDQPGHPPSRIRVVVVRIKTAWVLSYLLSAQRRLRSGWADAQADLRLRWAQSHFVGLS